MVSQESPGLWLFSLVVVKIMWVFLSKGWMD